MIGFRSRWALLTIFRERFFDAASGKDAQSKLLEEDPGSNIDCIQESELAALRFQSVNDAMNGSSPFL